MAGVPWQRSEERHRNQTLNSAQEIKSIRVPDVLLFPMLPKRPGYSTIWQVRA